MKCKVCGFQFESDRSYCPMCGARAKDTDLSPDDIQWNTKDFPKPKDIQDIPMRWSSPDASEGYFTAPTFTEKKAAEAEKARVAALSESEFFDDLDKEFAIDAPAKSNSFVNIQSPEPKDPFAYTDRNTIPFDSKTFNANTKSPEQNDSAFIDKNHTFAVDKDQFQKELDKEFERLRDVQKEDDFGPVQGFSAPAGFGPAFESARTKSSSPFQSANQSSLFQTNHQNSFKARNTGPYIDLPGSMGSQKKQSSAPRQDRFDIDAIEDTIEEIVAAEAKAQAESSERKRKLAAMAAARDAYFKSLDDGEFENGFKKKNPKYDPKNHQASYTEPRAQISYAESQAQVSYTEPQAAISYPKANNVRIETDPEPQRTINSFKYTDPTPETPNLKDLTGTLQDDDEHTMKFDKKEFLQASAKMEAEREAKLAEEEARLAQEAKLAAEADRLAQEAKRAEAERLAQEAKRVEAERLAQEAKRAEAERLAQEAKMAESARLAEQAKLEQNRQEREDAWIEVLKKAEEEDARRKADYEAHQARLEAARKAEEEARLEAARKAEEEARLEAERLAEEKRQEAKRQEEEQARLEAERLAAEEAERKEKYELARKAQEEADRKAQEEANQKALQEAIRKAQIEAEAKAQEEAAQRVAEIEAAIQARMAENEERLVAEHQAEKQAEKEKLEKERQVILEETQSRLDKERAARIEAEKKLEEERIAAKKAEELRNIELAQIKIKEKETELQKTQDFSELFKMSNEIGKAIKPIEAPDILDEDNTEAELTLELSLTGEDEEMARQRDIEDHPLYTMKTEKATKLSDLVPERGNHEVNTDDTQSFSAVNFTPAVPAKPQVEDLDELYSEEDIKNAKKHRVLPIILFSVIILIAVIELAIFVLGKFMPEQAFVVTLTEINDAVIRTISDFFKSAGNGIATWVQAAVARVQEIFKGR